jgi:hypothetical protein
MWTSRGRRRNREGRLKRSVATDLEGGHAIRGPIPRQLHRRVAEVRARRSHDRSRRSGRQRQREAGSGVCCLRHRWQSCQHGKEQDHDPEDGPLEKTQSGVGLGSRPLRVGRRRRPGAVTATIRSTCCHVVRPPFGSPAGSLSPVALRPPLAEGVRFRVPFGVCLV